MQKILNTLLTQSEVDALAKGTLVDIVWGGELSIITYLTGKRCCEVPLDDPEFVPDFNQFEKLGDFWRKGKDGNIYRFFWAEIKNATYTTQYVCPSSNKYFPRMYQNMLIENVGFERLNTKVRLHPERYTTCYNCYLKNHRHEFNCTYCGAFLGNKLNLSGLSGNRLYHTGELSLSITDLLYDKQRKKELVLTVAQLENLVREKLQYHRFVVPESEIQYAVQDLEMLTP